MTLSKRFSFWKLSPGETAIIRFLPEDGMTPAQRKAKRKLDLISRSSPTTSWLDRDFFGEPYFMPGTSLPAYRYTYITNADQRDTKAIALVFEQKARDAGYPIRAGAHLTKSGEGGFYWKVETFIPAFMVSHQG